MDRRTLTDDQLALLKRELQYVTESQADDGLFWRERVIVRLIGALAAKQGEQYHDRN